MAVRLSLDQERALLASAAEPTLERIGRAARSAAAFQVRELLRYLERELFSVELDLRAWVEACNLDAARAGDLFQGEMGVGLWDYALDCRLEVGVRLLIETELGVRQIADLVGSPSRQAFHQSFKRWSGLSPSQLRTVVRELRPEVMESVRSVLSSDFLRRLASLELTDAEAGELAEHLGAVSLAEEESDLTDDELERLLAEEIWEQRLAGEPAAWFAALLGLCFTTPALAELQEEEACKSS